MSESVENNPTPNPDPKAGIQVGITNEGRIAVGFPEKVQNFTMSPEAGATFALSVLKHVLQSYANRNFVDNALNVAEEEKRLFVPRRTILPPEAPPSN